MTSSRVIAMSGRLYVGSERILMDMVPHCVAVNASLLDVSMDTGVTEWRFSNRSKFPDMWLDAAESNSHVCAWLCMVERADISVERVTLESSPCVTSIIHAIMLMFCVGCPAMCADACLICGLLVSP